MSEKAQRKIGGRLWLLGFLIILFCLCGAACGVIISLAFDSSDEEPVGTIVASNNVVQRRRASRALWERLAVGSHIYSGDTIRTADLSGTTLYIERSSLDLNEKTFISIQRSPEDEDSILIYLDEGNLVITTAPGSGKIAMNLMGSQVEAAPGTILSASAGKDGAIVQVSEGTATLTGEKGEKREIASGTMIALAYSTEPRIGEGSVTGGVEIAEETELVPQPVAFSPIEQLEPLLIPLFPEPLNRLPPEGYRIGIEQLKESNSIDFLWSATQGANAYILTLYEQTANGLRQIIRGQPGNQTRWTLENLAALGNGTFIWQVEAVNMSSDGTIMQRGKVIDYSFIIDIPLSGKIQMEDPGTLYVY